MIKKFCMILLVSVSLVPVFLSGCEKKDTLTSLNNTKIENIKLPGTEDKANYFQIDVYFDGTKDGQNAVVGKEQRLINKEDLLGTLIMQELIKGPSDTGQYNSILPKNTELLSLTIKDDIAYVNLSNDVLQIEKGEKEKALMLAIVKSLIQIPDVKKVQIQVENKIVDSLGGKYDVSKPFGEGNIIER